MQNGSPITIKDALFSLTAILLVLLVPHSGIIPLPFGYSIPVLLFVWLFLKRRGENFADIGFSFKRLDIKSFLIGTIAGILIFAFVNWLFFPLLEKIVHIPDADLGDFAKLKGNTGFFIFILLMAWLVGGIYEEIVFHGFIFTRIEKMINKRQAMILSFVITNLVFAFYHIQLGLRGVLNALVCGLLFQGLMLLKQRNMWYAIFAHAVFDTIALTFLYLGYK